MVSNSLNNTRNDKGDLLTYKLLLEEAKSVISEKDKAIHALESDLHSNQNNQLSEELENLKASYAEVFAEKKRLSEEKDNLTHALQTQQQECNVLKVKLQALQSTQQQLEAMQKQFEYFFEQNRQQLEQATNALGTHVTDVSKHIASDVKTFVNFQQVFGISHQSVDSLNEKIPPELLLYLHNLLHKKSFDLIIVFGSEALTTFLAKELAASANQKHQQRQHRLETDTVTIENSTLPKRILSFEHKKDKVKALKHSLLDKQLSGWVNVRFAPLVDCHLGSKDYVFYDISKPLGRIADTFEDVQANILVVQPSDSLPSELSKDAILPLILQELGTHQIELLALSDNTVRSKQIEQWTETLNRREAEYELVESHPSLPNSIVLKLNP